MKHVLVVFLVAILMAFGLVTWKGVRAEALVDGEERNDGEAALTFQEKLLRKEYKERVLRSVHHLLTLGHCVRFAAARSYDYWKQDDRKAVKDEVYQQVPDLLEGIGPLAIKLGQWQAAKSGMVSEGLRGELVRLQEHCTAHPWAKTEALLAKCKLTLTWVDKNPIGVGSVAQVYRGTWPDGRTVVLKVVHPGLKENMMRSIEFVENTKLLAEAVRSDVRKYTTTLDFASFYRRVVEQIDLRTEAQNARDLRAAFTDVPCAPYIVFPEVLYDDAEVLVETYEEGEELHAFVRKHPDHGLEAVGTLWWVYYRMLVKANIVHGDVHLGNLRFRLVQPFNEEKAKPYVQVVVLDFGMVTRFTDPALVELVQKTWRKVLIPDPEAMTDLLLACSALQSSAPDKVRERILDLFHSYKVDTVFQALDAGGLPGLMLHMQKESVIYDEGAIGKALQLLEEEKVVMSAEYANVFTGMALVEDYRQQLDLKGKEYSSQICMMGIAKGFFDPATLSFK